MSNKITHEQAREIKFRAYSTHLKKYVKIDGRYKSNENGIIIINGGMDVILEQYTGLKDKNGVEIYEGDLLKTALMVGRVIYHSTVSGGIGYYVEFNDSIEPLENMINSYEIIGNIHEGEIKMSKSIYEEALEKIDVEFDAWDRAEHLELLELVEHALEKAQKQEKSLMIYKELANVRDEMLDACEIVDDDYYDVRKKETNLEQQIKELENDK